MRPRKSRRGKGLERVEKIDEVVLFEIFQVASWKIDFLEWEFFYSHFITWVARMN